MYPGKIYLARCLLGKKKIYIGQTTRQFTLRQNGHKKNSEISDGHFQRAIKKYGFENFIWEILMENIPKEDLDGWEQYFIWLYQSYTYGYNSTIGGSGNSGFSMSDVTKQKMSNSRKSYIQKHPEVRQSLSKRYLGTHRPESVKLKISEKLKNRKFSEEFFIKKKNKRYITDGKESKQINLGDKIPAGWKLGRTYSYRPPRKPHPNLKRVQCIETGEIFPSVAAAYRATGASNIRYAIRENKTSNGYHWQLVINTKEV